MTPKKIKWKIPISIPLDVTMLTTGPANPFDRDMNRKISAMQRRKAEIK
jgi:hypothetical protein